MTIYVDEIQEYATGKWCHCWTDETDDVLDRFAFRLGLKRAWSHCSHGITGRFYHYDLRPNKRALALKHGAVFMPLYDWIKPHLPEEFRQS